MNGRDCCLPRANKWQRLFSKKLSNCVYQSKHILRPNFQNFLASPISTEGKRAVAAESPEVHCFIEPSL